MREIRGRIRSGCNQATGAAFPCKIDGNVASPERTALTRRRKLLWPRFGGNSATIKNP